MRPKAQKKPAPKRGWLEEGRGTILVAHFRQGFGGSDSCRSVISLGVGGQERFVCSSGCARKRPILPVGYNYFVKTEPQVIACGSVFYIELKSGGGFRVRGVVLTVSLFANSSRYGYDGIILRPGDSGIGVGGSVPLRIRGNQAIPGRPGDGGNIGAVRLVDLNSSHAHLLGLGVGAHIIADDELSGAGSALRNHGTVYRKRGAGSHFHSGSSSGSSKEKNQGGEKGKNALFHLS